MAFTPRQRAVNSLLEKLELWGIKSLNNYWSNQLVAQVNDFANKDVPVYMLYELERTLECTVKAIFAIDPGQPAIKCDLQVGERVAGLPEKNLG